MICVYVYVVIFRESNGVSRSMCVVLRIRFKSHFFV